MSAFVEYGPYVAAFADVLAGVCLAWPALRLSHHLLGVARVDGGEGTSDDLARMQAKYVSAMGAWLSRWDRRDHVLLWTGFSAFVAGSVIKLTLL